MDKNKPSLQEYFEPCSKWKKEEHQDTVEIELRDFKKEEVKVQLTSSLGQLTIKGEHKVDDTKSTFFNKTINVPKDCRSDDILATFCGGVLYVTIKKQGQIQDGDVTVIERSEPRLKLGGNKFQALIYLTLGLAIGAFVAKLFLSSLVDDCTCVAFKSGYSRLFRL